MNRININDGKVVCPMDGDEEIDCVGCRECSHCVHLTSGWVGCSFHEALIDFVVDRFSETMADKLKRNDFKKGWRGCSLLYLMLRLVGEVGELAESVLSYEEAIEDENRVLLQHDWI